MQSLYLHAGNVPRRPQQRPPVGMRGQAIDLNERGDIGAPEMAHGHATRFHGNPRKQGDIERIDGHGTIEFGAQHRFDLGLCDRADPRADDKRHDEQQDEKAEENTANPIERFASTRQDKLPLRLIFRCGVGAMLWHPCGPRNTGKRVGRARGPCTRDEEFLLRGWLLQRFQNHHGLVGARNDGFGNRYELFLLIEDAQPGRLPIP